VSEPSASPIRGRAIPFTNRAAERGVLDRRLDQVRGGDSWSLVVHGEPGVGKTALLDYLAGRASDCRLIRVAGVQSEMELAFSGLHQLCLPLLDQLAALPGPQREALQTTFGLSAGPAPDRFLVGLSVLSLLSEGAAQRPLICLVDDEQWLDRASAQMLAFVARRLGAESVGLVLGTRVLRFFFALEPHPGDRDPFSCARLASRAVHPADASAVLAA
jgi:predicted ATPase